MVGKRNDLSVESRDKIIHKLLKFTKDERLKLTELYKTKSATEIGKIYEVNAQTIQRNLKAEGIKIRNYKESQQLYLSLHNERSLKQSEFMKTHNPMNNPESRKKCSQPGKKNPMWNGGKYITCSSCGMKRYLKPSRYKKLILKGICWNCYKHSRPKSSIEIKVAEELKKRSISFEEQISFHGMFLDFLLPNKIVIEADGVYWHNKPENAKRDKRKNALLKAEGYILYRFTDKEILSDVGDCLNKIVKIQK